MRYRIRKRFRGLEDEFDMWWRQRNGGYDTLRSLTKYTFWNDPFGERKKNKLIRTFNTYISVHGLE